MGSHSSSAGKKGLLSRIPIIGKKLRGAPTVAVIQMNGVISAGGGGPLSRGGLNLAGLAKPIEQAFETKNLKAVAIQINSPGGSPVQSSLIATRLRALAAEKDVPILAFCEDAAASGGYWLACAADEIYVQPASIVGSIGVIAAGFGFPDLLAKIGVERRVYTSGDSKSQLDPFVAEKPADIKHLKQLQNEIHDQFKDYVRDRRDGKLKEAEKKLFSGQFWTGEKAVELGLVDALGDLRGVCREKFGDKVEFKVTTQPKNWIQRKLGLKGPGNPLAAAAPALVDALEERFWWNRLGL